MMDEIKEFYIKKPPTLKEITDLRFRHFRLRTRKDRFVKVDKKIRTSVDLLKNLVRYKPLDVYYSTSCWLNPDKLGAKTMQDLESNIFLYGDVAFDIDRKPFSVRNIEIARQETLKLLEAVKDIGLGLKYIAFSGGKGYHIVCKDPNKYEAQNPFEREAEAQGYRKKLVESLSKQGIEFDSKITIDTRRILRVPGTINPSTGFVCTAISEEQLSETAGKMLKYIQRVKINAPKIPFLGDDRNLRFMRTIMGRLDRTGARSRPKEYYTSFLSSNVSGLRRQIPIFKYNSKTGKLSEIEGKLRRVQENYKLGDILVFKSDDEICAITLDTVQQRRAEKILKAAESLNYATLLKYKQTYMSVGRKFNSRGVEFGRPPKLLKTIKSPYKDSYISRPHYLFLKENKVKLEERPRKHGKTNVFITHALIED